MLKIGLKSLNRPKIIYSILIILLITSVTFYVLKEKERKLRIYTQGQLTQEVETQRAKEQLYSESLKKDLEDKEQQIKATLYRVEREIATRKKVEAQLMQTQEPQVTSAVIAGISNRTLKQADLTKVEQGNVIQAVPIKAKRKWFGIILWSIGLVSISGLGFLFWAKFIVTRTKDMSERIKELKLQLEKKEALLEQVEIIRKTIEKTAIEKEREYAQLKLELEEKSRLFEQEATIRCEKEKALQELEREQAQLKETSESLKDVLIKRGIAKELTTTEGKEGLWILGKSQERRNSPRLILTKDFHNTVILKIELPSSLRHIKSFAEDISSDGLCFQTQEELDDNHPIDLRLFFYGGKVPNFKTQGWIVWKRPQDSKIYYGITFGGLSEKVKSELQNYIGANIPRG